MSLITTDIHALTSIKGILFPADERFRRIILTGPPGTGKSTLIQKLGGWPMEGYIDLARKNWWRSTMLSYRPREVHFGLPFHGHDKSHAVYDLTWLASPGPLDEDRIRMPPEKKWFFSPDWRARYAFYFHLFPADITFVVRSMRAELGSHYVDSMITKALLKQQVDVYEQLALFFARRGMNVFIRSSFEGPPRQIHHSLLEN